jgi:adenylosuccinate synthase
VRFNGLAAVALTRLDVLDNLESIKICTGYELDGKVITTFPSRESTLERIKPIYEELPGWQTPTTEVRTFDDLPAPARAFIKRVETLLECPVDLISVGPSREQAVIVNPIF